MIKNIKLIATSLICVFLASAGVQAQSWPNKPITLIVPTPPGGTTDFSARLVAESMSKTLGVPVLVDNKPGGSGNIGNQFVARSKPDGYTLLVSYSGYHVGNPHLFKQAGWDPIRDFAPVGMMTVAPQVIAINPKLPINSLKELIAYAKKNPGKLNYASSGSGSIQHIAGELFKQQTGTFITHIPYRGSGPAVQDLMGGQVDMFITTPAGVVSQIQAGRLRGLAVTGKKRLGALPQMPTTDEAGLPNYELDSWFAMFAPAGTNPEIIQKLNLALGSALNSPEAKTRADGAGTTIQTMTPAELGDFTRKELDRWGKVIQTSKMTVD
jgi:tripartite-type tricarboxylate transporter receptor subunit TctC